MAAGEVLTSTELYRTVMLIDAATAATDGVWIGCDGYTSGIITVILGGGTMSITAQGTNATAQPAAATDGAPLAAALTATGIVSIPVLPRWLKADGTITTGPVTAIVQLRR